MESQSKSCPRAVATVPDAAAPQAGCCARRGEADETPTKAKERAMAGKRADEARTNKKAEVIALLKRTKVVTPAEIVKTTGWREQHG